MPYHCAAKDCHNGTYRLKRWMKGICETHQCNYGTSRCICEPPFRLYPFPTELRNPMARQKWKEAIKRCHPKKPWLLFDPSKDQRVCSIHFVDGKPTEAHPYPELHLGYKVMVYKSGVTKSPFKSKRKSPIKSQSRSVNSPPESNIDCHYNELDSDVHKSNETSPSKSKQKSFVKSLLKSHPPPDSNSDLDSNVRIINKLSPSKSQQKSSRKCSFTSPVKSHPNIKLILDTLTSNETSRVSKPEQTFKYLISTVGSPPYSNIELVSDNVSIDNDTSPVAHQKRTFKYVVTAVEPLCDSEAELVSDKYISNETPPISKRKRTFEPKIGSVESSSNCISEMVSDINTPKEKLELPVSNRKWTFKYYDGSVQEFKSHINNIDPLPNLKVELDSNKCTNILSDISKQQKLQMSTCAFKQKQPDCENSINMSSGSVVELGKDNYSFTKESNTSSPDVAAFNIWCLMALQCWLTVLVICLFGFVKYFQEKVAALQKENEKLREENRRLQAVMKMFECNQMNKVTSSLHRST